MAGPLSGIAGQQQIPLSQPTQLDQNSQQATQLRQNDQQTQQPNRVQPQGAPVNETQDSNTEDLNNLQARADELLDASNDGGQQSESLRRGSLIDVVI